MTANIRGNDYMASGIPGIKSGPFLAKHQAGNPSETNTAFHKSHAELTAGAQNVASNSGVDPNYGMRNELNSKQYQT